MESAVRFTAQAHRYERGNHSEITHAVDQEAVTLSRQRNDRSRQGRTNKPGHIDHRGVQRDGITKILLVLHHLHEEGLPAGHVKGVDRALEGAEPDDLANGNVLSEREKGERERLQHRQSLRYHQNITQIQTVNPNADSQKGPLMFFRRFCGGITERTSQCSAILPF